MKGVRSVALVRHERPGQGEEDAGFEDPWIPTSPAHRALK
jgi:hypothetical protein